ncbi:MAG: hypothetical protein JWR62_2119 [Modestobacter sp.]|jgi:hypothetical protein|nr:hypothetical protein [Modestobacter sp.]HEV7870592.1 DUF6766 family protein [Modestobacter sp.]
MTTPRRPLRDNGLGLAFGALFLATLAGQSFAGQAQVNADRLTEGLPPVSWLEFVTSSTFGVDVMENWQSEYLQFFLYVFATVWLVQRGSPESKEVDRIGTGSDEDQLVGRHARPDSPRWAATGGWRTTVFSRSLGLLMGGIFLATWAASSITGWASFNSEQLMSHQDPVDWAGYLGQADFWNRTLQNWQSEMLAVGSMAVFAVHLRQRGSPESKPVGASQHDDTGETG